MLPRIYYTIPFCALEFEFIVSSHFLCLFSRNYWATRRRTSKPPSKKSPTADALKYMKSTKASSRSNWSLARRRRSYRLSSPRRGWPSKNAKKRQLRVLVILPALAEGTNLIFTTSRASPSHLAKAMARKVARISYTRAIATIDPTASSAIRMAQPARRAPPQTTTKI